MALQPGTRLGFYEITAQIGVGGMGEVYQATDTKLDRQVAIKVLPEEFTQHKGKLARFEREARMLGALNYQGIATLYGLEEFEGKPFLVMELVEGLTLAERIEKGAIPLDEALLIAAQIAEALEEAHRHGIIHRDLKPANIKVRGDGTVKVLDFGLAKALDPVSASSPGGTPSPSRASSPGRSPTVTSAPLTEVGKVMGTPAYMSPEQARGRPVDKRADIWAFGAVLYEMLTGSRAFLEEDMASTLSRVLHQEPDFDALPAGVPAKVRQTLRVCLRKDPKQRFHDIADVILALEGAFETEGLQSTASAAEKLFRRQGPAIAAVLALGGLLVVGAAWSLWPTPDVRRVTRLTITQPAAQPLAIAISDPVLALSPDGTRAIYRVAVGGKRALVVRPLDALEATVLYDGRPLTPFFSPDGAWVGFFEQFDDSIKRVAVTGGPALTVAPVGDTRMAGATWGADDTIIFGTFVSSGLWQVPSDGGTPKPLTTLDETQKESNHEWPELLPGGEAVLFTIRRDGENSTEAQIVVRHLGTGEQRMLVSGGSYPKYVSTGHVLYVLAGTLWAVPFDLDTLTVTGNPVEVLEGVLTKPNGAAEVAVAQDGSLLYVAGVPETRPRTLVWIDRQGREEVIQAPARTYLYPRLSPDGKKIAVDIRDQENDIWIWDLARTTLTRLTFDPGIDRVPVWTPDGRRIAFSSQQEGSDQLFWQAADGSGTVERLSESANRQFPNSFSPDGTQFVFIELGPADLAVLTVAGDRSATPLVKTPFEESNGAISPNGRWLAYQSNESGRMEIYVRPFPNVDEGRWQISTNGGWAPLWARSGRELFYRAPDGAVMGVAVEGGTTFKADTPMQLFQGPYLAGGANAFPTYDVSPGNRFLMIKEGASGGDATPPSLILVQNWFEELERLVPAR